MFSVRLPAETDNAVRAAADRARRRPSSRPHPTLTLRRQRSPHTWAESSQSWTASRRSVDDNRSGNRVHRQGRGGTRLGWVEPCQLGDLLELIGAARRTSSADAVGAAPAPLRGVLRARSRPEVSEYGRLRSDGARPKSPDRVRRSRPLRARWQSCRDASRTATAAQCW